MKHVASKANLAAPSNAYVQLHGHEVDVLDTLDPWLTRLFLRLVRLSDFRSGIGSTTFAQLAAMLEPIQPRRGTRLYAPNAQACKKGVRLFEDRRILARDKARSDQEKLLFFTVLPRGAQARPKPKLDPLTRSHVNNGKARPGAASQATA